MPITTSAKKAIRNASRKYVFNVRRKRVMHDTISEVRRLATAGKAADALKALPQAFQSLDKAVKRGVIKANAAARQKSRLVALIRKNAK